MPLVRYVLVMGGMLLSLLFLADRYLPKPQTAAAAQADIDRSTIRLRSSQRWPEAVRFDTGAAMPPPAAPAANDLPERRPVATAALEALAAGPPPTASQTPARSEGPARHAKHAGRSMMRNAGRRFAVYQPRDSWGWPSAGR